MNKNIKKALTLFFISALIFFYSCEEVEVIENQTIFKETIIVAAELKANQKFEGVLFSRSLPLNEDYDITKAELKNVSVYLRQNGNKIIPLHYIKDGTYNSIYDLIPLPGDVYELFAINNKKYIYSKTTIPQKPGIVSALITGDNFIETLILPKEGEVYGALWMIQSDTKGIQSPYFYNIYESTINPAGTKLYLRTDKIPVEYIGNNYSIFVRVFSFDRNFLDYFQTKNNNEPINDIFSQIGAPINWNVQGEDVIGLFIGMATSTMAAE